MKEYKTLPFSAQNVEGLDKNQFAGYASTFGFLDDDGDIIQRGAFASTLDYFLAEGFIAWQHQWSNPIGSPLEAREDEKGLWLRAQISDTAQGRDAVTLMRDRVVKKLSIGFEIEGASPLSDEQGIALLGEAQYQAALRKLPWYKDQIRLITQVKLYEVSPVSVPANREADILAAKSADLAVLPYSEHSETVGSIVRDFLKRTSWKAARRLEEGRRLSEAHAKALDALLGDLTATADEVRAVLKALGQEPEAPDPGPGTPELIPLEEANAAFGDFLATCARIDGLL